jgi:hypothetical protein
MTEAEGKLLHKGQAILLNAGAPEWTRDKVFYVEEIRFKGVICWAESTPEEAVCNSRGQAFLRVAWDQIDGPETRLLQGLAGSGDLTGGYPD